MRKAMLFFAVFAFTGSLWAADPIIGTWKLNVGKSKAAPGKSLQKESIDVCRELDTNEIECVSKGVNADGSAIDLTISFPSQGGMVKLQPPPPKTISYVETLVEPGNWIVTFMMNGTQVVLLQKVVSKDGKTCTATTSTVGTDGKRSESLAVYDKQ